MYKNNCKQFEVLSPCRKKFDTSFLDFDIVYSHSQFLTIYIMTEDGIHDRVAGLGRLSAGAKMAMKPFVKRVFTIFATNASFLRVIANNSVKYAIYTIK